MEATPSVYRRDIARTQQAIADIARILDALPHDAWLEAKERRARLVQQLANLERDLARAEVLWAQAQAQGAGTRRP